MNMAVSDCAAPGCDQAAPPRCIFCTDCHFRLPPHETRFLARARFVCQREDDPERRMALEAEFRRHVRTIAGHLPPARREQTRSDEPAASGSAAWEEIGYAAGGRR